MASAPAFLVDAFQQLLARLGPEDDTDVERVAALFGLPITGALRDLLSRRGGEHALEVGAWVVDDDASGYPEEHERFAVAPFEVVLGDRGWLHAAFSDAIPIGRDGGGQLYLASVHPPHEVCIYDPGQGAVRFLAADLLTFGSLALLGQQAEQALETRGLDDPEDADPDDPALTHLRAGVERIAERINLTDDVVATDFDELLIGMTGQRPSFRPQPCHTELRHERADWLVAVLGMGYDAVRLDALADTFEQERADPAQWASPAVRGYWLWRSFVLGEDTRLATLRAALAEDPARLVADGVRLIETLLPLRSPADAPPHLRDVVRSRLSLSTLWARAATPLTLPPPTPLPRALQTRVAFLADEGYSRDDSSFTEEARECVAAIRHEGFLAALMPQLDRPLGGGAHHRDLNPLGAALLPFDVDPTAAPTLRALLDHRSRDLSHLGMLPGVVRALGDLGATDCVPALLGMLEEFAVVWEHGYAKAGSLEILEAICDALARLPSELATEALVALATRDADVDAAHGLRSRALLALALRRWSPAPAQRDALLAGPDRCAALVVAAAAGRPEPVDERLEVTPATCLAAMCAAPSPNEALPAARIALQTLFTSPFDTELAHVIALEFIDRALPSDASLPVLKRFVRVARAEGTRRAAIALVRKHEPGFTPTFCDRATTDAAYEAGGVPALVALLESPSPVFAHDVFAKAAEIGAPEAVAAHLLPFARDLAQFQHRWPRGLPYGFETQYYAEISALQAVGEPACAEAIDALWTSGMVGRERVESVVRDREYEGIPAFEARLQQQRRDEAAFKVAYASRDLPRAVALLGGVVERCPSDPATLRNLGHAHLGAGDFAAAHEAYRRAATLEPGDAMGWYWASQACYALSRWPEVIRYARQGLSADPGCLRCRFNLGIGLQATDQLDEAMQHYDRLAAADLGPEAWMRDDLGLNRATVQATLGRHEDAAASLREVFARSPDRLASTLEIEPLVTALGRETIEACASR